MVQVKNFDTGQFCTYTVGLKTVSAGRPRAEEVQKTFDRAQSNSVCWPTLRRAAADLLNYQNTELRSYKGYCCVVVGAHGINFDASRRLLETSHLQGTAQASLTNLFR